MEHINKRLKIAIVCRTIGLEYDDRIRKECITLAKNAEIKIFAVFSNNKEEEGITSYGVPYKSFHLSTRDKLKASKFLLIKAFEFYIKVRSHLKEYDRTWAHEEYTFLFPFFAKKNKLIWDLHEIPSMFNRPILRNVFHIIEKKSLKIIHGNAYRIKYMESKGLIKMPEKHAFIRNYPDHNFLSSEEMPPNYTDFIEWVGKDEYVYLQGLTVSGRYPYNSIASVLEATEYKIVVVGSFEDKDALYELNQKYGDNLKKRVFFTGMVNQLAIPPYVMDSIFTIVLYNNSDPNNRYCEPNRLYQAINFAIPVITGSNESMAEIININSIGIALSSDGRDLQELIMAIKKLQENYSYYKSNSEKHKSHYIWNDNLIKKDWYVG